MKVRITRMGKNVVRTLKAAGINYNVEDIILLFAQDVLNSKMEVLNGKYLTIKGVPTKQFSHYVHGQHNGSKFTNNPKILQLTSVAIRLDPLHYFVIRNASVSVSNGSIVLRKSTNYSTKMYEGHDMIGRMQLYRSGKGEYGYSNRDSVRVDKYIKPLYTHIKSSGATWIVDGMTFVNWFNDIFLGYKYGFVEFHSWFGMVPEQFVSLETEYEITENPEMEEPVSDPTQKKKIVRQQLITETTLGLLVRKVINPTKIGFKGNDALTNLVDNLIGCVPMTAIVTNKDIANLVYHLVLDKECGVALYCQAVLLLGHKPATLLYKSGQMSAIKAVVKENNVKITDMSKTKNTVIIDFLNRVNALYFGQEVLHQFAKNVVAGLTLKEVMGLVTSITTPVFIGLSEPGSDVNIYLRARKELGVTATAKLIEAGQFEALRAVIVN